MKPDQGADVLCTEDWMLWVFPLGDSELNLFPALLQAVSAGWLTRKLHKTRHSWILVSPICHYSENRSTAYTFTSQTVDNSFTGEKKQCTSVLRSSHSPFPTVLSNEVVENLCLKFSFPSFVLSAKLEQGFHLQLENCLSWARLPVTVAVLSDLWDLLGIQTRCCEISANHCASSQKDKHQCRCHWPKRVSDRASSWT